MKNNNKKGCYYRLFCVDCKAGIDESVTHTRCLKCGGVIDVDYDYKKLIGKKSAKNVNAAFLYNKLMPLEGTEHIISLKEGNTPLYKTDNLGVAYGLKNLYVKNEGANPTGVFKDRGSSLEVTKAVESGAKAMIIASSGNMAASCTAYASKAGLDIYVLVPENTPVGKLAQIMSYGARVIKIKADYSVCVSIAERIAKEHGFYLSGDYVFRREGQKTLAYELAEQMLPECFDAVIVPTGAGTHIAGLWKGFKECKLAGLINRIPRMIAVQPEGCAVLARAYKRKKKNYNAFDKADTICSAVAVTDPSDGNLALRAVYDSGGLILALKDDDALNSQKDLASLEGIFTEPSSALAIAAVLELKKKRILSAGDRVVCIATGNGLKDPVAPLSKLSVPKTLDADFKAVSRYIRSIGLSHNDFNSGKR